MQPGTIAQLDHLPLHVYDGSEGSETKPCAEVLLIDAAVERILEQGLIPLIGFKGRDSVRVGRFQPIADDRRPMAGPWNPK
jgi:type VI secretion system protein ImpC